MVKRETRAAARKLREQGKSVGEIARILEVSKGSVSVWVRDIELTQAQIEALKENQRLYGNQNSGAKANQQRAKAKRIAYQLAGREHAKTGSQLHLIGCMLYWAEGAKSRNAIYFANSDSNMMTLFMQFLRVELGVYNEDVRLLIHCHTNDEEEIARIENYWTDLLQLPTNCLLKTQIKVGSDSRKNILENGVCSIRVYSTELTQQIFGAIQEYSGFDNPDWLS